MMNNKNLNGVIHFQLYKASVVSLNLEIKYMLPQNCTIIKFYLNTVCILI
jgi:hypothetical protein